MGRVRGWVFRVIFAMSILGQVDCAGVQTKGQEPNETDVMHGAEVCQYVPTVSACQAMARMHITDKDLLKCILKQCEVGAIVCHDETPEKCVELARKQGDDVGGYVHDRDQTYEAPNKIVHWCNIPQAPYCQDATVVHEKGHSCGWHHGDGKGVPGDSGKMPGCILPEH